MVEILLKYIEIIVGCEEVWLIYLGVFYIMVNSGCCFVIDIGGGLIELIIGEEFEFIYIEFL